MSSDPEQHVRFPLYHGTSTLFLGGIAEHGLGGRDPIAEWKVLDCAKAIYPVVELHLAESEDFMARCVSFRLMVDQATGRRNFQHGNAYLSPSASTAIRYAVNTRYGSELLTYTLDFISELLRRKIPGIADDLFRSFPQVFEKLDISAAPVLVAAEDVSTAALLAENGEEAQPTLDFVYQTLKHRAEPRDVLLQQSNFRLIQPVSAKQLKVWLINVTQWDPFTPRYSLHPLAIGADRRGV